MIDTLKNGTIVVTENMPHLRSCSIGIWIRGGSVADPPEYAGIAHFCEHMAFKGTQTRSAEQIAQEFDAMGGYVNAYTAKQLTCYYCKTLDSHLEKGLTLLADMVLNPRYDAGETATEKKVILEEISMVEDSPDDLVMARLTQGVWRDSALGREILGVSESVDRITPEILREYQRTHYTGANMVVSASGSVDETAFLQLCEKLFGGAPAGQPVSYDEKAGYAQTVSLVKKDIEQNHLCFGFPGYAMFDERRYATSVFSALVGGTMSSRLFRKIREEAGLAYTVQSYCSPYLETGIFCVYTALAVASQAECLTLLREELDNIRENGFTDEELIRAKEQLKSGIILDLENTSSRMKMIAKKEIYGQGEENEDEIIRQIDAVTGADLAQIAQEVLDYSKMSISVVGNVDDAAFYQGFFR